MAEPTLIQVFGSGATQSATTLTIAKADLAAVGLTASATNTAESLLVALVLLAKNYLTTANQENNVEQNVVVAESSFNFLSFQTRNNQQYQQFSYEVNLQEIYSNTGPNPNNY